MIISTALCRKENMLTKTLIPLILFVSVSLLGAEQRILQNGNFDKGMQGWYSTKYPHRIEKNSFVADIPEACGKWSILLMQSLRLQAGKKYCLSYKLECIKAGIIRQVYQKSRKPYSSLGLAKNLRTEAGKKTYSIFFTAKSSDKIKSHLTFNLSQLSGRIKLSDVKVEEITDLAMNLNQNWTVLLDQRKTDDLSKIPKITTDRKIIKIKLEKNCIDLRALNGGKFTPKKSCAVLYNCFESDKDGVMKIGISADWWIHVYLNGRKIFSGTGKAQFSQDDHHLDLNIKKGKNILVAAVRSGSKGWRLFCGKPGKIVKFISEKDWKACEISSPIIKKDSALDLSNQIDSPAGKYGRMKISSDGSLIFEKKQKKALRLLGFNGFSSDLILEKDKNKFKKKARLFARAARLQGYSLFRVHGELDRWLCRGSKKDMSINPEYLDRWDYLISEFKKEGIYIHLVIFSFGLYSSDYFPTFRKRDRHKLLMYLNGKWEMDRFRYATKTLFNHINPYTGIAWKDDPVIAVVEYYNEQSLGIGRIKSSIKKYPDIKDTIKKHWGEWLTSKYKNNIPKKIQKELKGKKLKQAMLPLNGKGGLADIFPLFWMDKAIQCAKNCEKIIRAAGYPGLVTQYSYSKTMNHSAARWNTSQVVDVHAYYKHPSGWFAAGSIVGQESSIKESAGYWRNLNSTKLAGRPFMVGEYNHSFWNPYRYESGMVFAGYSALQGYSALMIHSKPVVFNTTGVMKNFSCGNSPLARALQFLSACLFQRGDLRKSPHMTVLAIPQKYLKKNRNAAKAISSQQNKIALITGFGIAFPGIKSAKGIGEIKPNMTILPVGSSEVKIHSWYSNVVENKNGKFSLNKILAKMKKKGIIPADNRSNPSQEIFESDTGEILLKAREKFMQIVTPKTECVSIQGGREAKLGLSEITKISTSGCVALCSVDKMSLKESKRIVLIYATEEVNSGMELSPNRSTMLKVGKTPVLAHTGELELTLEHKTENSFSLYALGIDGSRREKLPVTMKNGKIIIKINTAKLKNGPTPFFELLAE